MSDTNFAISENELREIYGLLSREELITVLVNRTAEARRQAARECKCSNDVELVCEALMALHNANGEYLKWKDDEYSQAQIPIKMKKIMDLYNRLRT